MPFHLRYSLRGNPVDRRGKPISGPQASRLHRRQAGSLRSQLHSPPGTSQSSLIAMPAENTTGICFPTQYNVGNDAVLRTLLEDVATCVAKHLREGGYFSDLEARGLLEEYRRRLEKSHLKAAPPPDFAVFVAETQAALHGLTPEGETSRIQKVLRWSLSDRVRCWTFGPLPGVADKLYGRSASLREACRLLGCPSMMSEEASIIHVTSVNPVAALVASAWITQELTALSEGEAPFAFPLMLDLASWLSMRQQHFASL